MSNFISAGVYTVEQDLSAYISDLSSTIVGLVGTAESGPTDSPVLITTGTDFTNTFGSLNPQHYLGYAAQAYLEKGNLLWVTRVSPSDASFANAAQFLPTNYTQYVGSWTLASQTNTTVTLNLSDLPTATGANKTISLDASTTIPFFDPTDTTNATHSNGKLGADLNTLCAVSNSPLLGVPFSITTGAGKNTTAPIVAVGQVGSSHTVPQVTLPITAFSTNNNPATALAASAISLNVLSSWTPPSANAPLLTVGFTSTNLPIDLVYLAPTTVGSDTTANYDALLALVNAGTFVASNLEGLITVVGGGTPTAYNIAVPVYSPTTAAGNAKTLAIWNAVITALLVLVNDVQPSSSSAPNSYAFYNACRVLVPSSSMYGVGSISSTGVSYGFSSIFPPVYDASSNILELSLASLVTGVNGTFDYGILTTPTGTLSPAASPLLVSNQVLTGTFAVNAYRPTWSMVTAGTSFVPTVIKFTSLGETDASNTAVVLSMNISNQTATDIQNYTLSIYKRISSTSVASNSSRLVDFSLTEQYTGTITNIQSQLVSSSATLNMTIDYTTLDSLNMTTGVVTPAVSNPDHLSWNPFFLVSETNTGISMNTEFDANSAGGYDKSLSCFMLGGSAGSSVKAGDIITGLNTFNNVETININILCAPGWSADPSVSAAMTTICQDRGDAIAVLDTPFGLTVQNVISYRNNIANINSSYAAMYYPWVKIADPVNNINLFVPPSGQVIGQYAYNDAVSDVYYAPAGVNRGMLTNALSTERIFSQGDRDMLALAQINCIRNDPGYGIYIAGQYTMQAALTALNRVNVRRMMLNLRKAVAAASLAFEFEPGDMTTAYRLQAVANTLLAAQQNNGAIQSYTIDVGPNVNTALVLSNNQLAMKISLVPTLTAEVIVETFTILPQTGVTSTTSTSKG